jgi:hypothetical protein
MKTKFKMYEKYRKWFFYISHYIFQVVKSFKKIQIMKMKIEKSITKIVVKMKIW